MKISKAVFCYFLSTSFSVGFGTAITNSTYLDHTLSSKETDESSDKDVSSKFDLTGNTQDGRELIDVETVIAIVEALPETVSMLRDIFGRPDHDVCAAHKPDRLTELESHIFQCLSATRGQPNPTNRRIPNCHTTDSCSSKQPYQVSVYELRKRKKKCRTKGVQGASYAHVLSDAAKMVSKEFGVEFVTIVEDSARSSTVSYEFNEFVGQGGRCYVYFFCDQEEYDCVSYRVFGVKRRDYCNTVLQPYVFQCFDNKGKLLFDDGQGHIADPRIDLKLLMSWYNPSSKDHFLTSTLQWTVKSSDASIPGYNQTRVEGGVFPPNSTPPKGTVPLFALWNPDRKDNFATTKKYWIMPVEDAILRPEGFIANKPPLKEGYTLFQLLGYIYDPDLPQPPCTLPLRSYWNPTALDNQATTGENPPSQHGYHEYRLEGFVPQFDCLP